MSDDLDKLIDSALDDLGTKTTSASAAAGEDELAHLRRSLSVMKMSMDTSSAPGLTEGKTDADKSKSKATETEPGDDLSQGKSALDDTLKLLSSSAKAAEETSGEDGQGDPSEFLKQMLAGMQAAGASAGTGGENDEDQAAMMEAFMKQMMGGGGDGSGPGMEDMMKQMMEAMISKDAIYESLCDLISKFPDWIAEKEQDASYPRDQLEKYKSQLEVMYRLKAEYDKPDGEQDSEKLFELINEMHSYGPPPPELAPEDIRSQLEQMQGGNGGIPDFGFPMPGGANGNEPVDEAALAQQLENGCKQG